MQKKPYLSQELQAWIINQLTTTQDENTIRDQFNASRIPDYVTDNIFANFRKFQAGNISKKTLLKILENIEPVDDRAFNTDDMEEIANSVAEFTMKTTGITASGAVKRDIKNFIQETIANNEGDAQYEYWVPPSKYPILNQKETLITEAQTANLYDVRVITSPIGATKCLTEIHVEGNEESTVILSIESDKDIAIQHDDTVSFITGAFIVLKEYAAYTSDTLPTYLIPNIIDPSNVRSLDDAKKLLRLMCFLLRGGFHPDTGAADYECEKGLIFTNEAAENIDEAMTRAEEIFIEHGRDIYGECLNLFRELNYIS